MEMTLNNPNIVSVLLCDSIVNATKKLRGYLLSSHFLLKISGKTIWAAFMLRFNLHSIPGHDAVSVLLRYNPPSTLFL